MQSNVGETLQYNHKAKVSGYYEFTNAIPTTATPTSFNLGSEQMMTFDISAGSRAVNFESFMIEISLTLAAVVINSSVNTYCFRANPYINRAVLRSKVGRYCLELTEVPAFASTIPYRSKKNALDFLSTEVFGDKANDLVPNGTRLMQQDDVYPGIDGLGVICTFSQILKLKDIFAGIFEKNKDIPLTSGFYLDIYLCPQYEVIYQIVGAAPYAAGGASRILNYTANLVTLRINNISCVFKQQADDQINVGLQEYLTSGSLTTEFDYVQCQTQTTTASNNHNISQPITTIIGDKLKTIYYMIGLPRDPTNEDFYKMRYSGTTLLQTVSISSITVKLNNRVIGIYNITNGDHLQYNYGFLSFTDTQYQSIQGAGLTVNRGLLTVNNHFFLPIHVENLTSEEDGQNGNTGLPIRSDTNLSIQVVLNGTIPNPGTIELKHYVYMVGTKYLQISGKGIEIFP
jgi:hypothetical protein